MATDSINCETLKKHCKNHWIKIKVDHRLENKTQREQIEPRQFNIAPYKQQLPHLDRRSVLHAESENT